MAGAGCSGADFGPGGKESFSKQCFAFQLYSCERFVLSKCEQVIGKTLLDKNSLPGGENDHLNAIKLKPCIDAIEANRDLIVGVKVRLDRNITNNGRNELGVYNRAQMAASSTSLPLMVHHTNSTIDLASSKTAHVSCPGSLKKGDIYTHTY